MKIDHVWQPLPGSRELARLGLWFVACTLAATYAFLWADWPAVLVGAQ